MTLLLKRAIDRAIDMLAERIERRLLERGGSWVSDRDHYTVETPKESPKRWINSTDIQSIRLDPQDSIISDFEAYIASIRSMDRQELRARYTRYTVETAALWCLRHPRRWEYTAQVYETLLLRGVCRRMAIGTDVIERVISEWERTATVPDAIFNPSEPVDRDGRPMPGFRWELCFRSDTY